MLVSAVPAAAWADAAAAAGLATLAGDAAVLEMAYGGETPLAVAARAHGARYADGLGMLVHQAAHAIALALGKPPPLPPCSKPSAAETRWPPIRSTPTAPSAGAVADEPARSATARTGAGDASRRWRWRCSRTRWPAPASTSSAGTAASSAGSPAGLPLGDR